MFDRLQDLCVNSAHGCRLCPLGDYTKLKEPKRWIPFKHRRCVGSGRAGAPIMLIGDFPRDTSHHGVHSYRLAGQLPEPSEDHLIPRALQLYGISPDLIYGTTALKCEGRQGDGKLIQMPPSVIEMCRENHLGVEIESMEPGIIWIVGWHAADSVRRHFGMKKIVPEGGVAVLKPPKIWRFDKLLLIRTAHPNKWCDPRTWKVTTGNIVEMTAIIEVYLREVLYGNGRA